MGKKNPIECIFCKKPLTRKEAYVLEKDGKTVFAHQHHAGVLENGKVAAGKKG